MVESRAHLRRAWREDWERRRSAAREGATEEQWPAWLQVRTSEGSALVEKLRPGAQEPCNERAVSPESEQLRKTDAQPG